MTATARRAASARGGRDLACPPHRSSISGPRAPVGDGGNAVVIWVAQRPGAADASSRSTCSARRRRRSNLRTASVSRASPARHRRRRAPSAAMAPNGTRRSLWSHRRRRPTSATTSARRPERWLPERRGSASPPGVLGVNPPSRSTAPATPSPSWTRRGGAAQLAPGRASARTAARSAAHEPLRAQRDRRLQPAVAMSRPATRYHLQRRDGRAIGTRPAHRAAARSRAAAGRAQAAPSTSSTALQRGRRHRRPGQRDRGIWTRNLVPRGTNF